MDSTITKFFEWYVSVDKFRQKLSFDLSTKTKVIYRRINFFQPIK